MASKNNGKIGIDWKRKVKSEYFQICKQKRHKRADEAKMAWNQNRYVNKVKLNKCIEQIHCVCSFHFRNNIEKLNEEDQNEWISSTLAWEPKCIDLPHVNSMKRTEVTAFNGKI